MPVIEDGSLASFSRGLHVVDHVYALLSSTRLVTAHLPHVYEKLGLLVSTLSVGMVIILWVSDCSGVLTPSDVELWRITRSSYANRESCSILRDLS